MSSTNPYVVDLKFYIQRMHHEQFFKGMIWMHDTPGMLLHDDAGCWIFKCYFLSRFVSVATQILGSCPLRTTVHSINSEFHRSGQINFKSKFRSILKWFPFSKPVVCFFLRFWNRCNEPSNPQLSWLNHLNPKIMWKSNLQSFPQVNYGLKQTKIETTTGIRIHLQSQFDRRYLHHDKRLIYQNDLILFWGLKQIKRHWILNWKLPT